uniref:Uncharacterized protein n=1 Tax=Arundo donax TaxID=35708 RepID=A0A0A9BS44_ARUDO
MLNEMLIEKEFELACQSSLEEYGLTEDPFLK